MSHVSDFTKEEDQIVMDLVNFDNDSNLSLTDVEIVSLTPIGEGKVDVQLSAKVGSGYTGNRTVQYTRIDIQAFMDIYFPETPVFQQGDATRLVEFLPEINAALGANIPESSVVDAELQWGGEPNEVISLALNIHPMSMVYRGTATIRIDGNDIALSDAVAIKVLSGLNMPSTDVAMTRMSMVNGGLTEDVTINFYVLHNAITGLPAGVNVMTNDRVTYRIDDGPELTYVDGNPITLPIGTQSFSVGNNSDYPITMTPSNTAALKIASIDEFQTTGHPLLHWTKNVHLVSVPPTLPSKVKWLSSVFQNATSFNQDLSGWDTSEVIRMTSMFSGAVAFNGNIGGWNVGKVEHFSNMFFNAAAFNQPIGGWDTSSAVVMNTMFLNATSFNQPIGSWDVSKVFNMTSMFAGATSFNQSLNGWDVSKVTTFSSMFNGATQFNGDISAWNPVACTNFTNMFRFAEAFNQPIGDWDILSATSISEMFVGAASFNQPIGDWDVNGVTSINYMFNGATSFNQPLGNWDTSTILTMIGVFYGATAYNQDLSSWVVEQVTDKTDFALNTPAWTEDKPPFYPAREWTRLRMRAGGSSFRGLVFGPTGLTAGQLSYRFDEGAWQDLALTPTNANHIYIPPSVVHVDIRNNSNNPIPAITAPGYGTAEVEAIVYFQTDRVPAILFPKTQYFTGVSGSLPATVTSLAGMFKGATTFNDANVTTWDTTLVTDMRSLFEGATAFNRNLSGWNVSAVEWWAGFDTGASGWVSGNKPTFTIPTTYTRYKNRSATGVRGLSVGPTGLIDNQVSYRIDQGQWINCTRLGANTHEIPVPAGTQTVDIRNNTASAIPNIIANAAGFPDFEGIEWFQSNREPVLEFKKTQYFTFVPAQIPSTITKLLNLFYGATTFNQDISGWDTKNIVNMQSLFYQASAFNRDISGWKVGKVNNMNSTFREATSFNQDLSKWCVSLIGSKPGNFDTSTSAWNKTNRQPVWGTCPLGS